MNFDKLNTEMNFDKLNTEINFNKVILESNNDDKTIPLSKRWATFIDAPACIKNTEDYIVHFDWEKKYHNLEWYDSFNQDRYSTVNMEDLIVSMEESESCDDSSVYDKQSIIDIKEEILAKNLYSFVFDW